MIDNGSREGQVAAIGLQTGTLGWVKVAALGVAIAVSGSFSGWNYGLAVGGWGGMFVAAMGMAVLFFCLTQCLSELAAMVPDAAGFDSYVEMALGRLAAYLSGMSVALGLAVGTGLAVSFAAAYCAGLFGVGPWPVKTALLAVVFALQLRGASETAKWTMAIGGAAVCVLTVFCAAAAPYFSTDNLWAPTENGPVLFRGGLSGTARCIPFALFLFLGVEQAAQAAAETRDVVRMMPRALLSAILTTALIGTAVLLAATGSAGVAPLEKTDDPLLAAVFAHPRAPVSSALSHIVGVGALGSLVATLFSLLYAGSRQFYYLAKAGFLPHALTQTNSKGAPTVALGIVAIIGVGAAVVRPEGAMVVLIFLLSVSHQLLLLSFIRLRTLRGSTFRPYKARGGRSLAWFAACLSLLVMISCYELQVMALTLTILVLGVLVAWQLLRRLQPAGRETRLD
jgi:ethanolamine permease